jgi:(4S)-4-hydroxy-5-phosphonooxypentane-2,3-dione isomerase
MYCIMAAFDVPPERHREFIAAALEDGYDSCVNEAGTRRLELIKDNDCANRFWLNEAYDDEAAFDDHVNGPYYAKFFGVVGVFATGNTTVKGTQIEEAAAADAGAG